MPSNEALKLVPFRPEHFGMLSDWFSSESEVVQWGGPCVHYPLDDEQLQAMLAEQEATPPTRLCWMAEFDGVLIGHAQLGFDWRDGNAMLGRVAIEPGARGRGLAAPMLRLVIDEAFARKQIQRVALNVYTFNRAAIRTYSGLGFRPEGVGRPPATVEGAPWDAIAMRLLRCDWIAAPSTSSGLMNHGKQEPERDMVKTARQGLAPCGTEQN